MNQYTRDSPDVLQQQTGNIIHNSLQSQLPRTEIDRERQQYSDEVLSINEEGRFVDDKLIQPKVKKNYFEGVQPKAYHINRSRECLVTERYESMTEQELQQIGNRTAEDSTVFVDKREQMRVSHDKNSYDTDKAAVAFYTWKQRSYSMCHDVIKLYQTRETVFHHISKDRDRGLKIRPVEEYF